MRCPVCGEYRTRRGWFAPQWTAESPVVIGTPSGDYDRCKVCYTGNCAVVPAPAGQPVDRKWDEHSRELCRLLIARSERCRRLTEFVGTWVEHNMHNRQDLRDHGAIDCITEADPKQYLYDQRWTFDPMNVNYAKAFHLTWPEHAHDMNRNSLGNILESVLGTRNRADRIGWRDVSHRELIVSVCTDISACVHAVYQLTAYTDTVSDNPAAWVRYVTSRAA